MIGIGLSGTFQIYNKQGILSGPFSALLLLCALICALLLLIFLDWQIWSPRRLAKAKAIDRWLGVDVLGNAAPPPGGWDTIQGRFQGRELRIVRLPGDALGAARWSMHTDSKLQVSVLRTPEPVPQSGSLQETEFSTGDTDFDRLYLWQSTQPADALTLLKIDAARHAMRRLATLFARHGEVFGMDAGVRIESGEINILQAPAPWLRPGSFSAEEVLLILDDLAIVAECLESGSPKQDAADPAAVMSIAAPNPWIALAGAVCVGLIVWLGGTYFLARFWSLSAAMVGFFIPPVMLAMLFMVSSAMGSGREGAVDDAIQDETNKLMRKRPDLARLAKTFRVLDV